MNDASRDSSAEPSSQDRDPTREEKQDIIYAALELVRAKYAVGEMSAYTIMVQAAADARTSVNEVAVQLLRETSAG